MLGADHSASKESAKKLKASKYRVNFILYQI